MTEDKKVRGAVNGVTLPGGVTVESRGDLDVLVLDGGVDGVTAELALQGGQLLSWCPPGDDEVLFLSDEARLETGSAVRGGVPVCFPWFGGGPTGEATPSHGWARTAAWELQEVRREGEAFVVVVALPERDGAPRLELEAGIGRELALQARMTGQPGATCELALHAYLGVGDVHEVTVLGLDGAAYLDQLTGRRETQAGDVTFTAETDRIYVAEGPVTLVDPVLGRRTEVATDGLSCVVVWNPWVDKAARTADLGDDEWRGFVCLEAAAVRGRSVLLDDAGRWAGSVTYRVAELPEEEA